MFLLLLDMYIIFNSGFPMYFFIHIDMHIVHVAGITYNVYCEISFVLCFRSSIWVIWKWNDHGQNERNSWIKVAHPYLYNTFHSSLFVQLVVFIAVISNKMGKTWSDTAQLLSLMAFCNSRMLLKFLLECHLSNLYNYFVAIRVIEMHFKRMVRDSVTLQLGIPKFCFETFVKYKVWALLSFCNFSFN